MRKKLRLANCGFNPSNKLQWGGCWYLEWNGYTLLAATFSNFLRGDFFLWRQPITRINKTRHQHSGPRPRYQVKSGMKTMECRPVFCPLVSRRLRWFKPKRNIQLGQPSVIPPGLVLEVGGTSALQAWLYCCTALHCFFYVDISTV